MAGAATAFWTFLNAHGGVGLASAQSPTLPSRAAFSAAAKVADLEYST